MEHHFWHQRWANQQIGFHQPEINQYLQQYWSRLAVPSGGAVFVPLCGKSQDMLWLREQGHPVLGVELNESACNAFFTEQDVIPQQSELGDFVCREQDGVRLLCGDFFRLNSELLSGVSAVYDRAALVALPAEMRKRYVQCMQSILPVTTPILLLTLEYEGAGGPPFNVPGEEVLSLYAEFYQIEKLHEISPDEVAEGERRDVVWLLQPK